MALVSSTTRDQASNVLDGIYSPPKCLDGRGINVYIIDTGNPDEAAALPTYLAETRAHAEERKV